MSSDARNTTSSQPSHFNPYLFDPRAEIAFSESKARVLLYVDGFKAKIIDIETDGAASDLQPIDLTHKFYNVEGADHDTPVRHTVRMIATDSRGLKTTYKCTFGLPW